MSINKLNQLFESQNNWDFDEPNFGHEKRFLDKLKKQQPKKKKIDWLPISIAASLLLGFGIFIINYNNNQNEEIAFSPQVQETHDYFSSKTKLSISTKIPEYCLSNRPIIAFGPTNIASFKILIENQIAFVIDSTDDDNSILNQLNKVFDFKVLVSDFEVLVLILKF